MFIAGNLALTVVHLIGILVYTRYNLVLGIPDEAFVLGTSMVGSILFQLLWIPGSALCSQRVSSVDYTTPLTLTRKTIGARDSGFSFFAYYAIFVLFVVFPLVDFLSQFFLLPGGRCTCPPFSSGQCRECRE